MEKETNPMKQYMKTIALAIAVLVATAGASVAFDMKTIIVIAMSNGTTHVMKGKIKASMSGESTMVVVDPTNNRNWCKGKFVQAQGIVICPALGTDTPTTIQDYGSFSGSFVQEVTNKKGKKVGRVAVTWGNKASEANARKMLQLQ